MFQNLAMEAHSSFLKYITEESLKIWQWRVAAHFLNISLRNRSESGQGGSQLILLIFQRDVQILMVGRWLGDPAQLLAGPPNHQILYPKSRKSQKSQKKSANML